MALFYQTKRQKNGKHHKQSLLVRQKSFLLDLISNLDQNGVDTEVSESPDLLQDQKSEPQ